MRAFFIISLAIGLSAAWNHDQNGVDWRTGNVDQCAGTERQSPIDLVINTATADTPSPPLSFSYLDKSIKGKWTNTKHDAKFVLNEPLDLTNVISGGPLGEDYALAQFHIHWGSTGTKGSEHTLSGTSYPAEIHFVHFKKSSGDIGTALSDPAGLAVVGFWLEFDATTTPTTTSRWPTLLKAVKTDITQSISRVIPFNLRSFLGATKTTEYFNYKGSLTTPPCLPIVEWIMMKNPVKLAPAVLQSLRLFKDDRNKPIVDNFRVTQNADRSDMTVKKIGF